MASLDYASFSSDELEFMAENDLVRIEPKFSHAGQVNFIMVRFVKYQQQPSKCAWRARANAIITLSSVILG